MARPSKRPSPIDLSYLAITLFAALSFAIIAKNFAAKPIFSASTSFSTSSKYENLNPATHLVPPLWRRLGAKDPSEIPHLVRTLPRRQVFSVLADEYLAPWSSPVSGGKNAPISAQLLDAMEVPLRWYTVGRIRLSTMGSVLFRVVQHWDKTYRLPRFVFLLDLVTRVLQRYPDLKALPAEFYVNAADGPRATVDSASLQFSALPIFSFRTEKSHIDIPLPDPVEHGSHVTGEGYMLDGEELSKAPSWENRKAKAVFRGSSSSIPGMHSGNWFLNPRVRVNQISAKYPNLVDAGVSKWIKLTRNTTVDDIVQSAGLDLKEELSLRDQLTYKYILDVDGGLGSSRKRWMLRSGSVAFFQTSTVYQWYEPLLVGWVHYIPVDKWFRDLIRHVRWAQLNDREAEKISQNGREFAEKYLSDEAILEYIAVLLQKYSALMEKVGRYNEPVANPCLEEKDIENGPMGCRTDWYVYERNKTFPFWCKHKPMEHLDFICRRQNPETRKKEVKHGIHSSYDNEYDIRWRVEKAKQIEAVKLVRKMQQLKIEQTSWI